MPSLYKLRPPTKEFNEEVGGRRERQEDEEMGGFSCDHDLRPLTKEFNVVMIMIV